MLTPLLTRQLHSNKSSLMLEAVLPLLEKFQELDKTQTEDLLSEIVSFLTNPYIYHHLSHPELDTFWKNLYKKQVYLFNDFFDLPQEPICYPHTEQNNQTILLQLIGLYKYIQFSIKTTPESTLNETELVLLQSSAQYGCIDALKVLFLNHFFKIHYGNLPENRLDLYTLTNTFDALACPFLTVGYLYAAQLNTRIALEILNQYKNDADIVRFFDFRLKAIQNLLLAHRTQKVELSKIIMKNAFGLETISKTCFEENALFITPPSTEPHDINNIIQIELTMNEDLCQINFIYKYLRAIKEAFLKKFCDVFSVSEKNYPSLNELDDILINQALKELYVPTFSPFFKTQDDFNLKRALALVFPPEKNNPVDLAFMDQCNNLLKKMTKTTLKP